MKNHQSFLFPLAISLLAFGFNLHFLSQLFSSVQPSRLASAMRSTLEPGQSREISQAVPVAQNLKVSFLDVGQGDSTLLRTAKGAAVLIDSGPPSGPFKESLSEEINLFDKNIDLVLSTHPDADHIGGLKGVLQKYEVGMYLDSFVRSSSDLYLETERMLREKKQPRLFAYEGMKIRISDSGSSFGKNAFPRDTNGSPPPILEIEILAPSFEYVLGKIKSCADAETEKILKKNLASASKKAKAKKSSGTGERPAVTATLSATDKKTIKKKCVSGELMDTNEMSVVALVRYGKSKIMLTGDAPVKVEKYALQKLRRTGFESIQDLHVDILKAGHHGSKTSTGDFFVEALRPTYAIISASKSNRYGHPHKSVTDTLEKFGSKIFSTGETGTISFLMDGIKVRPKD